MNPSALANWKPCATPEALTMKGRYVTLTPLDAAAHAADLWQAVEGHDGLWDWLAGGPYAGPEVMLDHLQKWAAAERAVLFAIVPTDTGRAAGWASLMRIKPAHGVIEVGNVLFSPALQRTRAATEAMYLIARHVFDDLGYRRYEWKCNARNEASRRAALRYGFSFEGIFRQHMVVKSRSRDTAWFAMLDHEWPEHKRAFEEWIDPANFDASGGQRRSLAGLRDAEPEN